MSNITTAKLTLFKDLQNCVKGESVRITGLWENYSEDDNTATMMYDGIKVIVHLNQIDHTLPQKGDVVQCLGEIMEMNKLTQVQARIIRSVNTLDLELYEKVIELRNSVI